MDVQKVVESMSNGKIDADFPEKKDGITRHELDSLLRIESEKRREESRVPRNADERKEQKKSEEGKVVGKHEKEIVDTASIEICFVGEEGLRKRAMEESFESRNEANDS